MENKQITYTKDGKPHRIKLSSALSYDKKHPAYKAAQQYVKRQKKTKPDIDTDTEQAPEANTRLKPLKRQYKVKSSLPKEQSDLLNKLLNTESNKSYTIKDYTDKFNVGTIKSATGELLSLSSYTMSDNDWNKTYKDLLAHVETPKSNIDASWVHAANANRVALKTQLNSTYGNGWKVLDSQWNTDNLKGKHDGIVTLEINGQQIKKYISLKKDSDSNIWTGGISDLNLPESVNTKKLKQRQIDVWNNFQNDKNVISDIRNNSAKLEDYADTLNVKPFERNKIKTLIKYISQNDKYPFDNTDEMKEWRKIQGFKSNPTEYKRYSNLLAQMMSKNKLSKANTYISGASENFNDFSNNFKNEFKTNKEFKKNLTQKITNVLGIDKIIKDDLSINIGAVPVHKNTIAKILGTDDIKQIKSKLKLSETKSGNINIIYSLGKDLFIPLGTVSLKKSSSGANVNIKFTDEFLCKNLFAHIDSMKSRDTAFNMEKYYNTFSNHDRNKYSKCKRK